MFHKENRVNFQTKCGEVICHSCGAAAVNIECPASKVWEFDESNKTVTVYHHGLHTCVAKPLSNTSKEVSDDAESKFRAVKKLGAKAYSSSQVIQAIEEGKTMDDVLSLASKLEPRRVNRIKDKVKQSMDSSGHSFDAIAKYKATTDKLDKYLVYRAQNGSLSGGPSYVFKTSKTQLKMALEMDKDGGGSLSKKVCFGDGNHKRCPGYITLTLWVRILTYFLLSHLICKKVSIPSPSQDFERVWGESAGPKTGFCSQGKKRSLSENVPVNTFFAGNSVTKKSY